MSLKNKLNRLKTSSSIDRQQKCQVTIPDQQSIDIPYREDGKKKMFIPFYFDEDYCLIREVRYPLSTTAWALSFS